jgi:SWI/SNF-related matrix-associated actin-dependent regulator of chromatin subfamily A-like protein 1
VNFQSKYIPRDYQIVGKNFLRKSNYRLLGDSVGIGKTGQAIIALESDWTVLVVCPASIKTQWKQALLDWRNLPSTVIDSSKPKSYTDKILIVNYDLIIKPELLSALMKFKFDVIIFDEAHRLSSISSKRTKAALGSKGLRSRAKRIWFLTGTPVKNRTIGLYPMLKACAPEVLGKYDSYLKFAYRYCGAYQNGFGLDTSGASHTEELSERLQSFMLRREKREVLTELPPRIISVARLDCTPAVRKIIEQEENKTMEVAGENDPSLFKLGEMARVRGALAKYKVAPSIAYIKDLLDVEEKIVVFYHHKEVLNELRRALQTIPSVFIDGSIAPNKREAVVEEFRTRKDIRVFLGQMGACGEGINGLQQSSSCCVFVEPSWSHTDIEQCIGRLERSGQVSPINVHILVIDDTLEDRMMDVVAMKLNTDKKLYNQQEENQMAKREPYQTKAAPEVTTEDRLITAIEKLSSICEVLAEAVLMPKATMTGSSTTASSANAKVVEVNEADAVEADEGAVEVETEQEEITEDVIRARANDICQLKPDGSGKTKVLELIKKIGGGKIADLKTQEQRNKAMAGLDKLYNQLAG